MVNFGTLKEQIGGLTLAAGLALTPTTAATAQDVNKIVDGTTFSSLQEANRVAIKEGLILSRDFHGETRIVSPELAKLLSEQGFIFGVDGILYGYQPGNISQGLNFAEGQYIEENSTEIRIEAPKSENKPDQGEGEGEGEGEGPNIGDIDPETGGIWDGEKYV